jgi:hypothetical protein
MEEQASKAAQGGDASLYSAGSAMAGCRRRSSQSSVSECFFSLLPALPSRFNWSIAVKSAQPLSWCRCLASERRYFVLSPPPLDASRNSAIEETQREKKKKSQTATYQPFLKPSLMVARSSDDTQTPIWGNKRRGLIAKARRALREVCVRE